MNETATNEFVGGAGRGSSVSGGGGGASLMSPRGPVQNSSNSNSAAVSPTRKTQVEFVPVSDASTRVEEHDKAMSLPSVAHYRRDESSSPLYTASSANSSNSGGGYRRITTRTDHTNRDTTSPIYLRANMRSTAELLASSGCNMSPTMHADIRTAPSESATLRCEQPVRAAKSTSVVVGGSDGAVPTPPETFADSFARLRDSVLTKGGLSYELTHRSNLDPTVFQPSTVSPSSLSSVPQAPHLSTSHQMHHPANVQRGSAANVSISPLRTAPLVPYSSSPLAGRPAYATGASSVSRQPSDGYVLVQAARLSSADRANSQASMSGSQVAHYGSVPASPRRLTPQREGSVVCSPSLGSTVMGYDYESRMRLCSPRGNNQPDPNPGGFYSKLADRSSPGRRATSPVDRHRPQARYC